MLVTLEVSHEPMGWLNAAASRNMKPMPVTFEVSHPLMSSLNELVSKATPPHLELGQNNMNMVVTRLVSQLGMSSHPAAPHRAELGFPQFGSVEQQF